MKSIAKNSLTIIRISYVLVMLSMTFQLFTFVPILQRHYLFWLISFIIGIAYGGAFFQSKAFVWMLFYIIVVFLNYVVGDPLFDTNRLIMEIISFFIPVTMTYYFFEYHDKTLIKLLLIFFGLFLIESTVASAYANSVIPEIMRLESNAYSAAVNASILQPFIKIGLSNYILPHAMPVIIPGLVYVCGVSKGWKKFFYALTLASAWVLAYVSCSFTAILVSTISLILSLLVSKKDHNKTKTRVIVSVIVLVPLAFNSDFQLSMLKQVDSFFPEESIISRKIQDLEMSIEYGDAEGGLEKRQEHYDMTRNAIKSNILIGTSENAIGGHSSIMDRLAALGLLGIIPYLLFLFYQIKYTVNHLGSVQRYYFYIGLGCALFMMMVKNSSYWAMWLLLFSLLPGLLWAWTEDERKVS